VRVHGAQVADISLAATRPEVQGLGLASHLLRHLEAALIRSPHHLPASPLCVFSRSRHFCRQNAFEKTVGLGFRVPEFTARADFLECISLIQSKTEVQDHFQTPFCRSMITTTSSFSIESSHFVAGNRTTSAFLRCLYNDRG